MANRMFNQFQGTLEKGVVQLFAEVTFAGTGAPTLTRGKGIASVARSAAGTYVVTFQDSYVATLAACALWKDAAAPAAADVVLHADAITNAAAPTLTFKTYAGSTVTDAASGEKLLFTFTLSNSTAL